MTAPRQIESLDGPELVGLVQECGFEVGKLLPTMPAADLELYIARRMLAWAITCANFYGANFERTFLEANPSGVTLILAPAGAVQETGRSPERGS